MKKRKFYEWLIVVILGFFLFYFIMSFIIVDVRSEQMTGRIGESGFLSFEFYKENLTFGQVFPGYVINRKTHVNNEFDFPVKIYFFPKGDMGEMVRTFPKALALFPGEEGEVSIYFSPSRKFDPGSYEGKMYILTRRTIFGV